MDYAYDYVYDVLQLLVRLIDISCSFTLKLVWNYGGHKNDNKAAKTTVNKENDRKLRKQ